MKHEKYLFKIVIIVKIIFNIKQIRSRLGHMRIIVKYQIKHWRCQARNRVLGLAFAQSAE